MLKSTENSVDFFNYMGLFSLDLALYRRVTRTKSRLLHLTELPHFIISNLSIKHYSSAGISMLL